MPWKILSPESSVPAAAPQGSPPGGGWTCSAVWCGCRVPSLCPSWAGRGGQSCTTEANEPCAPAAHNSEASVLFALCFQCEWAEDLGLIVTQGLTGWQSSCHLSIAGSYGRSLEGLVCSVQCSSWEETHVTSANSWLARAVRTFLPVMRWQECPPLSSVGSPSLCQCPVGPGPQTSCSSL